VALIHFMRLSLMKGAHADLSSTAWQEIGVKPYFGLSGIHSTRPLNQFSGFSETATKDPLGQDWCETGTGLVCLPITVQNGRAVALPLLSGNNGSGFGPKLCVRRFSKI
jgi:hypothetical protein